MTSSPQIKDLPSAASSHPSPVGGGSNRPTTVVQAAGGALGWAEGHQRWLGWGLGALLLATIAGWGLHLAAQRQTARDSRELAAAFETLEARVRPAVDGPAPDKSSQEATDPQEESLNPTRNSLEFASEAARQKAALEAFSALALRLGHRGVGPLAGMMAGHLEAESGLLNEAHQRLNALQTSLSPTSSLFGVVVLRVAAISEQRGDIEGALGALQPLVAEQNLYLSDEAGLMRARLLATRGDYGAARAALEHVRSRSPGSALLDDVRIALSELPAEPEEDEAEPTGHSPQQDVEVP